VAQKTSTELTISPQERERVHHIIYIAAILGSLTKRLDVTNDITYRMFNIKL